MQLLSLWLYQTLLLVVLDIYFICSKETQATKVLHEDDVFRLLEEDSPLKFANQLRKDYEDPCTDERDDCELVKYLCSSKDQIQEMKQSCRKTCGFCKPCRKDKWKRKTCHNIFIHKYCDVDKYKAILAKNCYETCYCKRFAAPLCEFDKEGCCWDRKTFARFGCPACRDASHVKFLCRQAKKNVQRECTHPNSAPAAWFRQYCPASCNLCSNCPDFKQFKHDCPALKKQGKCDEPVNRIRCKKSCGFCG